MEKNRPGKFKVGLYRFWIEYQRYFDGETTLRMRRRARMRRPQTERNTVSLGMLDLAGI